MAIGLDSADVPVSPHRPAEPGRSASHRNGEGRIRRTLGLMLVFISVAVSLGHFALLTNLTPIEPTPEILATARWINSVPVIGLLILVGYEAWRVWLGWYQGRAAARLHLRIVALFSLISALPALLVSAAFVITLDKGLDRWFENRTRTIVENVLTVASAYMQEHTRVLRADLIGIATALDSAKPLYDFEPRRFDSFFEAQATLRGLQSAYLLDKEGTVLLRTERDPLARTIMPPQRAMTDAQKGGAVLISPGSSNQVGGILKLKSYDETYLYVVRMLDATVLDNLRLARESAVEYRQLEASRKTLQWRSAMVFAALALVFLLGAVWLGLSFANRLVAPIRRLIGAADEVANGNLTAQVPVEDNHDDLSSLGATFNKMTTELRTQRDELLAANDQVDRRRRFTEAVLTGVTAAVVGVSNDGHVSIANRSATLLLGLDEFDLIGKRLVDEVPELRPLLAAAMRDDARVHQATITLVRKGQERTVSVRVASDRSPDREHGYVVTLDDITDLMTAQRTSAWADVARRIAHEIKNPLTPIQLSAERIRRRYGKAIANDDRAVFDQCVDTIVRQVGDIGRMVDEFSAFARMPKPTMEERDFGDAIREAVFLLSVAHPDIAFETHLPKEPMIGRYDHRLMSQAITNLVKNAVEAITALPADERAGARVDVKARVEDGRFVVDVIDTGVGLPATDRHKLLEPYMTTREKGTGLGLAIVRKIIEEHDGRIDLLDSPAVAAGGRGAMVRVTLPPEPSLAGRVEAVPAAASG
ncbi:sensor histidine kinase NtrY-like [Mongoliimonas terrestris]|uniref:sensor histidine kinase NtrY-like n=1 Tax=Mongoliimonas terrestris TaxID=1709001 RepID=UPI000B023F6C|nr:PAS domain-containing sensor histidine kinase [Mongoliimonas terrestris]